MGDALCLLSKEQHRVKEASEPKELNVNERRTEELLCSRTSGELVDIVDIFTSSHLQHI